MDPTQTEAVPAQTPKKKKPFVSILLALLIIVIGIVAWIMLYQKSNPTLTTEKTATSSAPTTITPEKITTTEPPVVDDTALITKALVAKTGIAEDKIDVTVSTKVDNFAKGLVGAKGEETGGGYFLAVKINGASWVIVFDGQSTPDCSVVTPYNFPATMVPECLDAGGNLVKR